MRFRSSVRMVMGLAAAGSAIVALSGTAAAADASSVNVAPQVPQQATTTLPTVPSVSNVKVPGSQDNNSDSSQTTTVQSGTVTSGANNSSSNNNNGDSAAKTQSNSVSSENANGSSSAGGSGVTAAKSEPAQSNSAEVTGSATSSDLKASVPDSAKIEAAVKPGAPSLPALPPVVRFRSEMLPVQPTIVCYETAPADLASALPSAPQQRQQPHPAKSSGMLGSLTAVLAGTVVPQPLMLGGMGIVPLAAALLFGLVVILLFTVFVFTYGSWLRRGGFATAARSDEPLFSNISSIATPLFLGYVMPLRRLHNPILVVADTQIPYKVLPPMLTERRIRI